MNRVILCCALVAAVLVGCGSQESPRFYATLNDFRNSPDFSWMAARGAIPDDASDINVFSDVETGLGLVSYETTDKLAAINALGLNKLNVDKLNLINRNIGFGAGEMHEIYFGCKRNDIYIGKEVIVNKEVIFAGSSNGRQYQWNSRTGGIYRVLCEE